MKFFYLVAIAMGVAFGGSAQSTSTAHDSTAGSVPLTGDGVAKAFAEAAPPAIDFIDFNTQVLNNKVLLKWKTSEDIPEGAFTIERSHNGTQYEVLGSLSSMEGSGYSYLDNTPLNGDNFYRISFTAKDGARSYSKTVDIHLNGRNTLKAYAGYGKISARIDLNETGIFHIALVNSNGQAVFKEEIRYDGARNTFDFQVPNQLPLGIYSVILKGATLSLSCQVLIK